ncbi:hypothetical protein LTS10_003530 [Elasticomyces elasticus]|nr:hypothetical protein LTS10_003530 [Elasticomyces elasticus]
MSLEKALPGFTRLAPNASLYRPDAQSAAIDSKDAAPQTIVFCAWFRALPKHIAKYTAAYQTRYPAAQTLLIQSYVADMIFSSHAAQRKQLRPAVDVLKAAQADGHRILLHVFSNGGTNSSVQLAHAWRDAMQSPLPATAVALDSCPGATSIRLAADAIVKSAPKNHQWWFVFVAWTVFIPLFVVPSLWGSPNLVAWLREGLNDASLFSREVPRVYLYSKADRMVPWSAVQDHCASSHNEGYRANMVRFRASPHVAHVNEDKERYWGAVDSVLQA